MNSSWVTGDWKAKFDNMGRTYKAFLHAQEDVIAELRSERDEAMKRTLKTREETTKMIKDLRTQHEAKLAELEGRPKVGSLKESV